MRFEFTTATRIVFGSGTIRDAAHHAKAFGRKAYVVTGANPARSRGLIAQLNAAHVTTHELAIGAEPSVNQVVEGARQARKWEADLVIGMGGGSVLDAAKAIAGLIRNTDPIYDYLEVVGKGLPLELPATPWIAIPTTAGTGAEVTKNAVLYVPEKQVKVSLRSPLLLASMALVDPELALGSPPEVTRPTGLDALCQLVEAYVCTRSNPMVDALCAAGIPLVARALPKALEDPTDLQAREDLALGALWSGMALANAGLGAVHGFAAPLGGCLRAPHGAVCGALLAPVCRMNLEEMTAKALDTGRYDKVAQLLTGRADASAEEGVSWLEAFAKALGTQGLADFGLSPDLIPQIAEMAQAASSMKANPVTPSRSQLEAALRAAL